LIAEHGVEAIVHFAGSIVVPESVTDPLGYYLNNTSKSRSLIEAAVRGGVRRFIFSSTAAVYGMAGEKPVAETAVLAPMSPYGRSKLMTELMLADTAAAHDFPLHRTALFQRRWSRPEGRTGQSMKGATHLIKVACETALGKRKRMDVSVPTIRPATAPASADYIHVTDLAAAHLSALAISATAATASLPIAAMAAATRFLEVIDSVKRVSGRDFEINLAPRRPGDPAAIVAAAALIHARLDWQPRLDDLDTIVGHALAWEDQLTRKNVLA